MLDEGEYAEIHALYGACFRTSGTIEERFRPVCDAYERLTGFRETNANAIMHHRLSLYGPPCQSCGKPLRTAKAKFCAACGRSVGVAE